MNSAAGMIKVILFDFDGVLVESVNIKTAAFRELFKDEEENDLAGILDYHKKHGGISRRNKIIYFYKNILKRKLTEERLKELEDRFSQHVKDKVIRASFVDGALEFLKKNYNRYDFYIISGTPQKELEEIVSKKNLSPYFLSVYGSPPAKSEIIHSLLSAKKYSRDEVIFVGDSPDDLEGAVKCGIKFVARTGHLCEDNVFNNNSFPSISSFCDLDSVISELNIR